MYIFLSTDQIDMTPEKAQSLLQYNWEGQRSVNGVHVNYLADEIRKGEFTSAIIALATNGDGQFKMVNGQHTCMACAKAGKMIKIYLEKYETPKPEDLSQLFRKFDTNRPRTLDQMVKVESNSMGLNWSKKIANLVVSAASIIEGKQRLHKTQKPKLLRDYLEPGFFVEEMIGGLKAKHMKKQGVVAAMIITWRVDQEDAARFWTNVRDGEGITREMPAYRLREWLMSSQYIQTNGMGKGTQSGEVITLHKIMSKSISAWNAYRRNTIGDLRYFANKPVPKPI